MRKVANRALGGTHAAKMKKLSLKLARIDAAIDRFESLAATYDHGKKNYPIRLE